MKIYDFYKTLKRAIKENEEMKEAVNQYETGLITFTDCINVLCTIENQYKEVKRHEL